MSNWITLIAETERHDTEIKELRNQTGELSATLQRLMTEQQRDRENAEMQRQLDEKDRELLVLRLEAKLHSYERRLPPPSASEEDAP